MSVFFLSFFPLIFFPFFLFQYMCPPRSTGIFVSTLVVSVMLVINGGRMRTGGEMQGAYIPCVLCRHSGAYLKKLSEFPRLLRNTIADTYSLYQHSLMGSCLASLFHGLRYNIFTQVTVHRYTLSHQSFQRRDLGMWGFRVSR